METDIRDLQEYDFWYPNPTRRSLNPPDPIREDFNPSDPTCGDF